MKWVGRPQSKNIEDMTNVTTFIIEWANYNATSISSDIIIFPDGNYALGLPTNSTTIRVAIVPRDEKLTFTEGHKKAVRAILKKSVMGGRLVDIGGGGEEVEEFFRAFLMNTNG